MSTDAPEAMINPEEIPAEARVGIAAARFNPELVEELIRGCVRQLNALGIGADRIEIHRAPGAFELPLLAKIMARSGRFDAIICLGAVVRGETPHFDFVAGQCARGLLDVGLEMRLPVIFGVLTTNTEQEARDRLGGDHGHAGERAAEAAAEMIIVLRRVEG